MQSLDAVKAELRNLQETFKVSIGQVFTTFPTSDAIHIKSRGAPLDVRILADLAERHSLDWFCTLTAGSESSGYALFGMQQAKESETEAQVRAVTEWDKYECNEVVRRVGRQLQTPLVRPESLRVILTTTPTSVWLGVALPTGDETKHERMQLTDQMVAAAVRNANVSQASEIKLFLRTV